MNKKTLIAILAAFVVSACAGIPKRTTDQEDLERYLQYAGEPINSVTTFGRYDGWRALGRDHLVVWTGVNDAYLLKITGACNDLPFANRIAIKSRGGPTLDRGDTVIVNRWQRCMITELRPIDYRKMKQDARKDEGSQSGS